MERVIGLIDMDCFFVQVEQRSRPELAGKPAAVTQYNTYKGGGIIAVNYEARAFGVKRGMRGEEAQQLCPDVVLFHTPQKRGKADSSKYREASFEVFDVLTSFHEDIVIEKASIDEAFLDLTKYVNDHRATFDLTSLGDLTDTHVAGLVESTEDRSTIEQLHRSILDGSATPDEINLFLAAKMIGRMRKAVLDKTKFHCSAGISHNKVMAKLAAGLHKPRAQTILTRRNMSLVLNTIEVPKLRHFGGKLGAALQQFFNVKYVGEITAISFSTLNEYLGEKTARFVLELAQGIDHDLVVPRKLSKSIGCGKNFSAVGTRALTSRDQVRHWITQLVDELLERLQLDRDMNARKPTLMIVSVCQTEGTSRSLPFTTFEAARLIDMIMEKGLDRLFKDNQTKDPIRSLSVAATKFEDIDRSCNPLETFFNKVDRAQYLESTASASVSNSEATNVPDLKSLDTKAAMLNYFQSVEQELFPRQPVVKKPVNTLKACFEAQINRANQAAAAKRAASEVVVLDENSNNSVQEVVAKRCEISSNVANPLQTDSDQPQPSTSRVRLPQKRGFFFRKTQELLRKTK